MSYLYGGTMNRYSPLNERFPGRPRRSASASPFRQKLEDEIYLIRRALEQAAEDDSTLTTRPVLELSRQLDKKINEYMKLK